MDRIITSSFFLFFVGYSVFSQEEKLINGKIIVKNATPQGVHVINLVNEKEVISDSKGEFSILAKLDDVLVFSSNHLDYQRKIIETDDYKALAFTIEMTSKVIELDEVEIEYPGINALSLGILTKAPKRYTPAERRLYSAQSGLLDSFLNTLSGRTAMLETGIVIEKKEFQLKELENLYPEEFYTTTLKIKKEYIKGFHYYIVENKKFASALDGKNSFVISLLIIGLAQEYNALFLDEKK